MNILAQVPIGEKFGSPFGQSLGINDLVTTILNASLVIGGILVLFLIIFAGFGIIKSAGEDNPQEAAKARAAATSAVIGFIVIFVAYWIVRIIEIITGVNFITIPGL